MFAGFTPRLLAMYLATSTSNPENEPSGFFSAKPGWSNLMPTTSLPDLASAVTFEPDAEAPPEAAALGAADPALGAADPALGAADPALGAADPAADDRPE